MKLEVGKQYLTQDKKLAAIAGQNEDGTFWGTIIQAGLASWTADGFAHEGSENHDLKQEISGEAAHAYVSNVSRRNNR